MDNHLFAFITFIGSFMAGVVGALSGLGGGTLIVPLLVLLLNCDFHYAIGAALLASIATSSGAAVAYLRQGYINVKVATFLCTATVAGAIAGAFLSIYAPITLLYFLFGGVLLYSLLPARAQPELETQPPPPAIVDYFDLKGIYPSSKGWKRYTATGAWGAFFIMLGAGLASGLLGIGSGALKVLALDKAMGLPYRVSTTTATFMIGVTAAGSAGIYFKWGYVDPPLAAPVVLGVLIGSVIGTRLLHRLPTKAIKAIFSLLVSISAIEMLINGVRRVLA